MNQHVNAFYYTNKMPMKVIDIRYICGKAGKLVKGTNSVQF